MGFGIIFRLKAECYPAKMEIIFKTSKNDCLTLLGMS